MIGTGHDFTARIDPDFAPTSGYAAALVKYFFASLSTNRGNKTAPLW
jgi:hypothetical protein